MFYKLDKKLTKIFGKISFLLHLQLLNFAHRGILTTVNQGAVLQDNKNYDMEDTNYEKVGLSCLRLCSRG